MLIKVFLYILFYFISVYVYFIYFFMVSYGFFVFLVYYSHDSAFFLKNFFFFLGRFQNDKSCSISLAGHVVHFVEFIYSFKLFFNMRTLFFKWMLISPIPECSSDGVERTVQHTFFGIVLQNNALKVLIVL